MLSGGVVWVAPVAISRKVALAIMKKNDSYVGVFAVSSKYARGLCDGLEELKDQRIMVLEVVIGVTIMENHIVRHIVGI